MAKKTTQPTPVLCKLGIHMRGRSDQGCFYRDKVCFVCKKDVLWLVNDEAKEKKGGEEERN